MPPTPPTRLISAYLLLNEAIAAAEAEGHAELVIDLLRAKQYQAWREYNRRIMEMTMDDDTPTTPSKD